MISIYNVLYTYYERIKSKILTVLNFNIEIFGSLEGTLIGTRARLHSSVGSLSERSCYGDRLPWSVHLSALAMTGEL